MREALGGVPAEGDGGVLPEAGEVHEAEGDKLDKLVSAELEYISWGSGAGFLGYGRWQEYEIAAEGTVRSVCGLALVRGMAGMAVLNKRAGGWGAGGG